MNFKPDIGTEGGQPFQVLDSIRTTVSEMGGGGGRVACTVLKELLQKADDAEVTEVSILLNERNGGPPELKLCPQFAPLCTPALLIRNNKPFRLPGEKGPDDVVGSDGQPHTRRQNREAGAELFTQGRARFLLASRLAKALTCRNLAIPWFMLTFHGTQTDFTSALGNWAVTALFSFKLSNPLNPGIVYDIKPIPHRS